MKQNSEKYAGKKDLGQTMNRLEFQDPKILVFWGNGKHGVKCLRIAQVGKKEAEKWRERDKWNH